MEDVSNVDDLRAAIWDFLYQGNGAKTIEELAAAAEMEAGVIRGAVEHQWFTVSNDRVSIAY